MWLWLWLHPRFHQAPRQAERGLRRRSTHRGEELWAAGCVAGAGGDDMGRTGDNRWEEWKPQGKPWEKYEKNGVNTIKIH